MTSSSVATIAFGGNQGGYDVVAGRFRQALVVLVDTLAARSWRCSRIFVSSPVGLVTDQPDFVNAVVSFTMPLAPSPQTTLDSLLVIEKELGRDRSPQPRDGPRAIDLDFIALDEVIVSSKQLILPHPRAYRRAFVLLPLVDLYGEHYCLPGDTQPIGQRLATALTNGQRIEPVAALTL